ncbi:hypothetical protein NLU13_4903 [Sarocladium strictum]|uniref:Acid phosphatase-like protein n=1 Tax=Sarocladium strictum TaxID=5046 RepID=A0AA39GJS0_SARSR|nr:hypothetical protein NLU13_4903 [Sarocladium strictum]
MVSTAGGIVIAIIVIALAAAVGWVVFTQVRARRLGLPPPSLSSYLPWKSSDSGYGPRPAPGGVVGWFNDQVRKFKNRNNRSAAGAYEAPLHGSGGAAAGRRGFGPLDPDEAWDAHVGTEADGYGPYDETELRSTEYGGAHGGNSYTMNVPEDSPYGQDERRGRSGAGGSGSSNPFDDDQAVSMRGVSPRPLDTGAAVRSKPHGEPDSAGSSPAERRSVFRENV